MGLLSQRCVSREGITRKAHSLTFAEYTILPVCKHNGGGEAHQPQRVLQQNDKRKEARTQMAAMTS